MGTGSRFRSGAECVESGLLPRKRSLSLFCLALACCGGLEAAQPRGGGNIGLRRRLFISPLISEPGRGTLDWNAAFDTNGSLAFPTTLRYTPAGPNVFWGRTELSLGIDLLASSVNGGRATQFSDHLNVAATTVLLDTAHFDVAVMPQASVPLRAAGAGRGGGTLLVRDDFGRNSVSASASWSGAVTPADGNPAGIWDVNAGYARRIATHGLLRRVTTWGDVQWERATGAQHTWTFYQGAEYEISERVALEFTALQANFSAGTGPIDRQVIAGVSIDLGRRRR